MKSTAFLRVSCVLVSLLASQRLLVGQTTATLTTLHSFAAPDSNGDNADGAVPYGLVQGSNGSFYGSTNGGGDSGLGTVFKITRAGDLTNLHNFTVGDGNGHNIDGQRPYYSVLARGDDGNFYGTTNTGGSGVGGTVFQITPAGVLTTLKNFVAIVGSDQDGYTPNGALVRGSDGNFYGTTQGGGTNNDGTAYATGTVFSISTTGVFNQLHTFIVNRDGSNRGGNSPFSALVQGNDGNFYGSTARGGSGDAGTIFKIDSRGTFVSLHDFTGTEGASPSALVQGSDGDFYGTTDQGGDNRAGSVFRLTPAGALVTLYSFTGGTDGEYPDAALVRDGNGNFYGTTGGSFSVPGTIFKITPAGVLTTLYHFTADANGQYPSGQFPSAALVKGSDGFFYGTTTQGGSGGSGTVFKMAFSPVINSPADAAAIVGQAFSYQITASDDPTNFGVQGLPAGLTVNAQTGLISGTPRAAGNVTFTLRATNFAGSGSAPLALTIKATPVITSATTATATQGSAFSYQITATNNPRSFGVQGLPTGFSVNATTGLITGTPKGAGKATLTLNASNAAGKGSATLTLTIKAAPPVVTSAMTASGKVGTAFSYQITATNQPTSFGVQGLPAGLSVSSTTGIISGTPKAAGKFMLTVNAYNSTGKGSATLTLTITGT